MGIYHLHASCSKGVYKYESHLRLNKLKFRNMCANLCLKFSSQIAFTKRQSYKAYNIYKAIMYFAIIAVVTDLFLVYGLTVTDVFAALLAFLPSAWAFVLVSSSYALLYLCCFLG